MLYHHLFNEFRKKDRVMAAVIGAGHFGTAVVTQQSYTQFLKIPIVVDKNPEAARNALIRAEIPEAKIIFSRDPEEAQKLIMDNGKFIYTDDAMMVLRIPCIDVVCEGTGDPQTGARICLTALENGKNVLAISKEMDSVIGPVLRKIAKEKGLVYSPVDGDQPALLMGMVEWARTIGLTVISAGKARDGEFILDEINKKVTIAADGITVHQDYIVDITKDDMEYFKMIPKGRAEEYIARRTEILKTMPGAGAFDLCEMVMVANATGLKPACPDLTDAALRITELPVAYCAKKDRGIYKGEGFIDVHTNLHRRDESGMGGGVYLVVRCDNAYSNYILTTKGQISNYDNTAAVIYRPYHLCGVEVSTSILSAGLLGLDSGTLEYQPCYDLVKTAVKDIMAGELLGNDHDLRLKASILPASTRGPENAVPGHMITGNVAVRDIKAGEIITYDMIEDRSDTVLWKLRLQQEKDFNEKKPGQ